MFNLKVTTWGGVVLATMLVAAVSVESAQQPTTREAASGDASGDASRDAEGDAKGASFTARIIGFQVSREIPQRWGNHGVARSMVANNATQTGGVRLLLEVTAENGKIIGFDEQNLRIDKFVDDTDRDLRPSRDNRSRNYYSGTPSVAPDGSAALVHLYSDRGPAADAEQILIQGVIPLRSTPEEKVSEPMSFPLSIGKQVEVGIATVTVSSIQLWGQDSSSLQVVLRSDDPLDTIRGIELIRQGGSANLPISSRGSKAGGHSVNQVGFIVPEIADEIQLRFTYTESVEETALPFSLKIDLGAVEVDGGGETDQN